MGISQLLALVVKVGDLLDNPFLLLFVATS